MQVNSAIHSEFGQQSLNSPQTVDNNSSVSNQRERLRVQQERQEQQTQQNQSTQQGVDRQQDNSQQQERFDVDQQGLALAEQEQERRQSAQQNTQATPVTVSADSRANSDGAQVSLDSPSRQNISAVSTYQSVGDIAQRDSVQQAFGVDLYA